MIKIFKKSKNKDGWVYCNVNPYKNETHDCSIRSIALFQENTWENTYKNLFKIALEQKNVSTTLGVVRRYLSEFCICTPVDIVFNNYSIPYEKSILRLANKKGGDQHMVFTEHHKYYDTFPLDGKNWKVVEVYTYIPK